MIATRKTKCAFLSHVTHVGYEVHDVIVSILTRCEELVLVPVGIIGLEYQFSVFLRVTVLHKFYNMKFELKIVKSHRSIDLSDSLCWLLSIFTIVRHLLTY